MTQHIPGTDLAHRIGQRLPGAVVEATEAAVLTSGQALLGVAAYLKEEPGLDFNYLASITAVDYLDYFEVTYHLVSLTHNHSAVLKVRCQGRDQLTLPSVVSLWQGADFQEREVFDLMGIAFPGHPNMKRILLWEGFPGHPLRKDFMY